MEAVGWSVVIGFFMLRFMTLGTKINRKYRNLSTLITEQVCVQVLGRHKYASGIADNVGTP